MTDLAGIPTWLAQNELPLVRAAHLLAVVLWIGGVGFVTTTLIPLIRRAYARDDRLAAFMRLEEVFAGQARLTVAIAGASGLWMTWRLALWSRCASAEYWRMHAMVAVWALFATMLYVLEPFVLRRRRGAPSAASFGRIEIMHRMMLIVSLVAAGGAVAGSHGLV